MVQVGLQRGDLSDENITIDRREIDEVEEQLVQDYARDGCNAITEISMLYDNRGR